MAMVEMMVMVHLWAGFLASMMRENACTMMLHSPAPTRQAAARAARQRCIAATAVLLENLRGRVARERCLKLCAMCRRSFSLHGAATSSSSTSSMSASTVITMLQNFLRSNLEAVDMGMHVTLMLASAMSRTRRFNLHAAVTAAHDAAAKASPCN